MQRRRDRFLTAIAFASCVALAAAARADVTVSTAVTGPVSGDGGAFTVTTTGTITGAGNGIEGAMTSLGVQGVVDVGSWAVAQLSGTLPSLTNSGTLTGGTYGVVLFGPSGTITNQAGGLIKATANDALFLFGSTTELSNAGRISGLTRGVQVFTGLAAATNSGVIEGVSGVGLDTYSTADITALTNSGTISGATHGMRLTGTTGTITNDVGGLITGTSTAAISGGRIQFLDNSGTIEGPTGIANDSEDSLYRLRNNAGGIIRGTTGNAVFTNQESINGNLGIENGAGGLIESTGNDAVRFDVYGRIIDNAGVIRSLAANGAGISSSGTVGVQNLFNTGTISGGAAGNGIDVGVVVSGYNYASGVIEGGIDGLRITGAAVGFTNEGQIRGGQTGLRMAGVLTNPLLNGPNAVISGTSVAGLTLENDYTIVGQYPGGVIESAQGNGIYITGTHTRGQLANYGLVSGGTSGLWLANGNLPELGNSGTISGNSSGMVLLGTSGTITNGGVIRATSNDAVSVSGSIVELSNAGSITGGNGNDASGVELVNSGTIGTFTNTGNVTGNTYAVRLSGPSGIGSLTNSGTLAGGQAGISFHYDELSTITSIVNQAGGLITGGSDAGIDGRSTVGTIDNAGTITGAYGVYTGGYLDTFINRSTGVVSGTAGYGVYTYNPLTTFTNEAGGIIESSTHYAVSLGEVTTFDNAGTIRTLADGSSAMYTGYAITTLTNSGTISADVDGGYGIEQDNTIGTLTNTASGLIHGRQAGLYVNDSSPMTVVNHGRITGGEMGVYAWFEFGPFTNTSGGVVSGTNTAGIMIGDNARTATPTITNEAGGLITSANGAGVLVTASGYDPGTIVNAGRIEGATGGLRMENGGLKSVTNTGTIAYTGTGTGPAVYVGANGVFGDATGASGPALTSTGSGALLAGTIENQGTVHYGFTIDNQNVTVSAGGGAGTFSNGTLTVTNGDLTITNGQTTLGADISVNGGAGTVFNEGTLRLLGIENVTGNFQQTLGGTTLMGLLGTGAGQYGRLDMTGSALFAGTLDLDDTGLTGGLADGQIFQFFEFGSYSGGFSGLKVNGTSLTSAGTNMWTYGSLLLTEQWTGTTMSLAVSSPSVIPEIDPAGLGSVLALVTGSLGLVERRRLARKRS